MSASASAASGPPPSESAAPGKKERGSQALLAGIGVLGVAAPFLAPTIVTQLAFLWLMILFAVTWDVNGGQMGYNSFGNILFFGIGVYACAVVQRDSGLGYTAALFVGTAVGALAAALTALVLGPLILGIRGHYFSIATLGLAVVAADLASAWEYIGAASGMALPVYPGAIPGRTRFFYFLLFALAALTWLAVRALCKTRLGLAMNAIRDNEDKAEAMGVRTTRCKVIAWTVAAFFLGAAGGPVANLVGFVDPRDLAFAGSTYGVWMVLMAVLGGRGTLWGPVIGAVIFHVTQETFWTYLLGWQRVAMGLLIVIIVVFFPSGILGWIGGRRVPRVAGRPQEVPGTRGARQTVAASTGAMSASAAGEGPHR